MEIIIKGDPKEIAALVPQIQERLSSAEVLYQHLDKPQKLFSVHGTIQLQGFDLMNQQLDMLIEKASKFSDLITTQQLV